MRRSFGHTRPGPAYDVRRRAGTVAIDPGRVATAVAIDPGRVATAWGVAPSCKILSSTDYESSGRPSVSITL